MPSEGAAILLLQAVPGADVLGGARILARGSLDDRRKGVPALDVAVVGRGFGARGNGGGGGAGRCG